jgi:rsbT co-antagonist protein RsbR
MRELPTPIIQVWEEVLVVPLVGEIDAQRAAGVMEDLLQGIITHQASIVIIDVTGLPMVDTYIVYHLMQTVKAAGLLGARSVLVGIGAEVALTMIQLGVNLEGVETRSNLQAGIELAFDALDLQVVSKSAHHANVEAEQT